MILFARTRSARVEGHLPGEEDPWSAGWSGSAEWPAGWCGECAGGGGGAVGDGERGAGGGDGDGWAVGGGGGGGGGGGAEQGRGWGVAGGELLVGIMAAQLAGEDFLVGLDRQRADAAGQVLTPVPGLASTTAAGLARRISPEQWVAVERGVAAATGTIMGMLPAARVAVLTEGATIDLDTTDVEVYGRKKRGVAYNYAGQRCGRPHVACWAETTTVLAADLLSGDA